MSDPAGRTSTQYQNQDIYDTILTELMKAMEESSGSPNMQAGLRRAIEIITEIKNGDWDA